MKPSFLAAAILLLLPLGAHADLPAEARKDIDQGLDAVQKKDHAMARQHFQDAREAGGREVYYEIGLAESKIPGRELRAICWFAAYLADNPEGANAAEIKGKIDALNAKSRDRILNLIQALQDDVQQMPDGDSRDLALYGLVNIWTKFGDYAAAKKVAGLVKNQSRECDVLDELACAYAQLSMEQAGNGDMAGARDSLAEVQRTAELVSNADAKLEAEYYVAKTWKSIGTQQLKSGDLKGAQETVAIIQKLAGPIRSPGSSNDMMCDIVTMQTALAKAQYKAGDAAGARESLAAALKSAGYLPGGNAFWSYKLEALRDIAETRFKTGDTAGAKETFAETLQEIDLIPNPHEKPDWQKSIVEDQIDTGDLAGAQKTAGLIQDADVKASMARKIAAPPKNDASSNKMPPRPSDFLTQTPIVSDIPWLGMTDNFDVSWLTSFPDYSDYKAIAIEMQKDPFRAGTGGVMSISGGEPIALDEKKSLAYIVPEIVEVQREVDYMLRFQFKK